VKRREKDALKRIASSVEHLAAAPTARDTSRQPRKEQLPLRARLILWLGTTATTEARAVGMRRSFPIRAYVGPNGGGKSLAMVEDALPTLRGIRWVCHNPDHEHTQRGITEGQRRVLSTIKLLGRDGKAHPLYDPFEDFEQLLHAEHVDVLMDEIVGIANSRDSRSLPSPVQNVLVQLRRRDVTLSWSAPNWARCEKILREVTQLVVECRGYFSGRAAAVEGSGVQLWAPKRVFKFRAFDTIEFEEWTAGRREKVAHLNRQWFKGPGSRAFGTYDTLGGVAMVTGGDNDGRCPYCDKRLRAEYCKGHTDAEVAHLEHQLHDGVHFEEVSA
jgi:hypothetical protein